MQPAAVPGLRDGEGGVVTPTDVGPFEVETVSGRYVDLARPTAAMIELVDVAHGLSMTCRYGGHCARFYSVAEHAVLVAEKLEREGHPEFALAGLHHDDAEAYLGDVPRPLKLLMMRAAVPSVAGSYGQLEAAMDFAVWDALGRDLWEAMHYQHPLVKAADNWAALTEARALMPSGGEGWSYWKMDVPWPVGDPPWQLGMGPPNARSLWLAKHRSLLAALGVAA